MRKSEMRNGLIRFANGVSWVARDFLQLVTVALEPVFCQEDRQLHDAHLVGEYNHRTGRLDAGNDPYGWYDED